MGTAAGNHGYVLACEVDVGLEGALDCRELAIATLSKLITAKAYGLMQLAPGAEQHDS